MKANKHITHNLMIAAHEDKQTYHTQPHDNYS